QALAQLEQRFAVATTAAGVRDISDRADTLRHLLKRRKVHVVDVNRATGLKVQCLRRMGREVETMDRNRGGRPSGKPFHGRTVLKELGITRGEAHRWRQLAAVPEGLFLAYWARMDADGLELTEKGVLNLADKAVAS